MSWFEFKLFILNAFFLLVISNEVVNKHNHDLIKASDIDWNYDRKGPDAWPYLFKTCSGLSQSPINIETDKTKINNGLSELIMKNFDQEIQFTFLIKDYSSFCLIYDKH